ncbi:MAG: hypothetical protein U0599_06795 [Vicinamibacteria bacterium]
MRALVALGRAAEAFEWAEACAGRDDCEPERTWLAARAAEAVGGARSPRTSAARAPRTTRGCPAATREQERGAA